MRKRLILSSCGVVVVIVVGALLWWLLISGEAPAASRPATSTARPTVDVKFLKSALESSSKKEQARALAEEIRGKYLQQDEPMLPRGTTVELKSDTFRTNGNTGQIDMTTSSGERYILRLTLEKDGTNQKPKWLILYTEMK